MCQKEQAWSSDEWRVASPGACLWSQEQGSQVETTLQLLFSPLSQEPLSPPDTNLQSWGKRVPNP